MRRVPPGLLNALPVHALGPLGIVAVVRDVNPRQLVGDDVTDAAHVPRHFSKRAHHEDQHAPIWFHVSVLSNTRPSGFMSVCSGTGFCRRVSVD